MKKFIIAIYMALFTGISISAADVNQGLVVKPLGFVTAAVDGVTDPLWNSIDPTTNDRFLLQKVAGEADLYKLEITLNKLYRTSKWREIHGINAPEDGVANEGWSELYIFQIVYKDEYNNPASTSQTTRKAFKVPVDKTTVTFYAKVIDGKIHSVCDAQEFIFGANEAGEGQGNILPAIGQAYTTKTIDTFNENKNSDQPNANILTQNTNNSFNAILAGKNDDFGGKLKLYDTKNGGKRGRVIITLHYNTISFTAEKAIDEIQEVTEMINDGQNLGTLSNLNIPFSANLSTVATKGTLYPLSNIINEDNTSVNLCYQLIKEGYKSDEVTTIRTPFTLKPGATNLSGFWELVPINLLEGQNLENGNYILNFWYESVYKGQYGEDTIIYNNGGSPFSANFILNMPTNPNEISSTSLGNLAVDELNTLEWLIVKGDMDDTKFIALQKALGNNNIITSIQFKEGNLPVEINTDYFANINPNCLIYVTANVSSTAINNLIVNDTAKEITIADRHPFNCPEKFNCESISYTRDCYTDNGWETIYLPFDVISISLAEPKIKTLKEKDANENLIFKEAATITANTAHIISFPGNEGQKANCTFSGSGTVEKTSESQDNILIGTYKDKNAEGDFILNPDGKFFGKATEGVEIWGFRAYISGEQSSVRQLRVFFDGDSPTGIETLTESPIYATNGVIYLNNEQTVVVYSIDGRKVYESTQTDKVEGLSKGIYIVNGQKVVIK